MKKILLLSSIFLATYFLFPKGARYQLVKKRVIKQKRNIASIKPSIKKITTKKIQTKVLPEIKNKFFNHINKDSKVTIYKKKEIPYTFNKKTITASVVQVKIKKSNGTQSSFDALVNEKNGNIIRTWNQTLFEKNTSFKISAKGKEFYSN